MRKLSGVFFVLITVFATTVLGLGAFAQTEEPEVDSELSMVCLFGYCAIGLISTIIWLLVSIWVKKDAEANNVDSPILWGVLVFFLGIIGLLIYLLAIKPKAVASRAKYERSTSGYGDSYVKPGTCPHCGYYAGTTAGRCPSCGGNLSG